MDGNGGQRARELLQRAKAESELSRSEALEELIREHFPRVNSFLRARFGDLFSNEERENYFLNVLHTYVNKPALYDPSRPLTALLCVAATNSARDYLKSRKVHELVDLSAVAADIAAEDTEFSRIDDRDTLEVLGSALSAEDKYILLTSKDEKGWAVEVAARLGLSANAVSKRWERIKAKLRELPTKTDEKPC